MSDQTAEREAAAWLATAAAETKATIENRPNDTIVPSVVPSAASTGGGRALASFEALLGDVHRLRLGDVIGQGGMGVVRSAEQVALGRPVAVKTLRSDKREAALDLLREAWVTGSLEHPNIIPIHALEIDASGTPSIVMKKIAGVEWSTLIRDEAEVARRFGAKDLLAWNIEILMRVLDALRFAHSHGIVHRDLKPANVMIGDFGEVYLLDWGIAVSLRDDASGRFPLAANATALAGTPSYMAPEMLGREDGVGLSERTDVYLAGAVLHEVIAGKPPHVGSNMFAVIASVITSRPELPATAPRELASICAEAMRADPAERFVSCDELRRALRDYLEHRGSDQIVVRARERLAELLARLKQPAAPSEDIYRLFGACRYGFRDALAAWPDNAAAAAGLVEAVVAVAQYELVAGRPHAAASLLGELSEPHPLLEQARAQALAHVQRVAELEQMERQHDRAIGTRTRAGLTLAFGLIFASIPIAVAEIPRLLHAPHALQWAGSFSLVVLIAAVVWWARETIGATVLNRRLAASVVFMFIIQSAVPIAGAIAQRPAIETYTWNLLLYAVMTGMLAITIERYLWPGAIGYLVAFLVASDDPVRSLYLTSLGSVPITVIAVWRWRPATIRYTKEERTGRHPNSAEPPASG